MKRRLKRVSTRDFRRGDPKSVETVRARVRQLLGFQSPPLELSVREDLEQEIMIQLWQGFAGDRFDHDREVWGYVAVLTTRRVIDWRRRVRRRPEGHAETLEAADAAPRQAAWFQSRFQDRFNGPGGRLLVQQLIASLSEVCRQILRLRFDRDLSFKEMAEELGQSEGSLRVRLHRCVREARKTLDEEPRTAP